jgi:hypothetical protein
VPSRSGVDGSESGGSSCLPLVACSHPIFHIFYLSPSSFLIPWQGNENTQKF